MKIKEEKQKKKLTMVQQLRQIRDKVNEEIKDLSSHEVIKYLKRKKALHSTKTWRKRV
ncbi:MAG: hypothetical protein N2044_11590 [Cyclobacteriaceae bacterium]|nr:hypothetical protein [Cyclobacteriaceae bacterium]MCX7638476.1 hypothetical protein [Cyclobacteriaceae bacterium]MDW8331706.1 hypothetical protein [Cyclobacteriaceae bacterium]